MGLCSGRARRRTRVLGYSIPACRLPGTSSRRRAISSSLYELQDDLVGRVGRPQHLGEVRRAVAIVLGATSGQTCGVSQSPAGPSVIPFNLVMDSGARTDVDDGGIAELRSPAPGHSDLAGVLPDGLCRRRTGGPLGGDCHLADPVGEALQDVRQTSCASTAAAHPPGVLAGGPVAASAGPGCVGRTSTGRAARSSPAPWLGGLRRC